MLTIFLFRNLISVLGLTLCHVAQATLPGLPQPPTAVIIGMSLQVSFPVGGVLLSLPSFMAVLYPDVSSPLMPVLIQALHYILALVPLSTA